MAVTEQPVDIVATRGMGGTGGPFVLGNHALRSSWINSFYVSPAPNLTYMGSNYGYFPLPSFNGYGAVKNSNGITTDQIGYDNQGTVTSLQAIYLPDSAGVCGQVVQAASLNPVFPAGSLPLAVVVLDGVQRVQQVIDMRPSYLVSAPNLGGGMTESVADATKRVYFQNNYAVPRTYALSAQIQADTALPAPGFFVGSGSVVLSGQTITTQTTYLVTAVRGGQLTANAINQIFISPSNGQLSFATTQTSGVFPANCLPICEATTDSVGLIRNITDWRPSYI
jgi:hypothetical protein